MTDWLIRTGSRLAVGENRGFEQRLVADLLLRCGLALLRQQLKREGRI